MKKIFIVFFFLISVSFAEELTLTKGTCVGVNSLSYEEKANYEIRYDNEEQVYYFYSKSSATHLWVHLDSEDLSTIASNIYKFLEWEEIARKNKASVDRKELPSSPIRATLTTYQFKQHRGMTDIEMSLIKDRGKYKLLFRLYGGIYDKIFIFDKAQAKKFIQNIDNQKLFDEYQKIMKKKQREDELFK